MPIYRLKVPQGSVSFEQREKIALDYTDIHCGSTSAPRHFVHVFFDEQSEGESPYPTRYYLEAINRAGRPQEVKERLLNDLLESSCPTRAWPATRSAVASARHPLLGRWKAGQCCQNPGRKPPSGTPTPLLTKLIEE